MIFPSDWGSVVHEQFPCKNFHSQVIAHIIDTTSKNASLSKRKTNTLKTIVGLNGMCKYFNDFNGFSGKTCCQANIKNGGRFVGLFFIPYGRMQDSEESIFCYTKLVCPFIHLVFFCPTCRSQCWKYFGEIFFGPTMNSIENDLDRGSFLATSHIISYLCYPIRWWRKCISLLW